MELATALVLVSLSWHLFGVAAVGVWQSSRMTAKRFQFICGLVMGCLKGAYALWCAMDDRTSTVLLAALTHAGALISLARSCLGGATPRDLTFSGRLLSDFTFWICIPIPLAWAISLAYSTQPVKPVATRNNAMSRNATVLTALSYGCGMLVLFAAVTTVIRCVRPIDDASADRLVLGILVASVIVIGVFLAYAMYRLMVIHGSGWGGFVSQFKGVTAFAAVFAVGVLVCAILLLISATEDWDNGVVFTFAHIASVVVITVALIIELRSTMRLVRVNPLPPGVNAPAASAFGWGAIATARGAGDSKLFLHQKTKVQSPLTGTELATTINAAAAMRSPLSMISTPPGGGAGTGADASPASPPPASPHFPPEPALEEPIGAAGVEPVVAFGTAVAASEPSAAGIPGQPAPFVRDDVKHSPFSTALPGLVIPTNPLSLPIRRSNGGSKPRTHAFARNIQITSPPHATIAAAAMSPVNPIEPARPSPTAASPLKPGAGTASSTPPTNSPVPPSIAAVAAADGTPDATDGKTDTSRSSDGSGNSADAMLLAEVDEARSAHRWSGDAFFLRCVELRITSKHIIALFFAGIATSLIAYFLLTAYNLDHYLSAFASLCEQLSGSMEDQLRLVVKGPLGLGSLVSAITPTGAMSTTVYLAYESQLSDLIYGSSNVYGQLIRGESERHAYYTNLTYLDIGSGVKHPVPPNARADYLPIHYIQFPLYLGWDVFYHPQLNVTARRVLRTGQVLSTPPYSLLTSTGLGWLIVTPVDKNSSLGAQLRAAWLASSTTDDAAATLAIEDANYANMLGITWTAINANGLLARVQSLAGHPLVRMKLFVESVAAPLGVDIVDFPVSTAHTRSQFFEFGGRRYELQCDVGSEFVDITARILLATLLLFTVVLCTLLWGTVLARRRVILRYADIRDAHAAKQSAINMLKLARKDADEANQSKSQFMSYLCHELRNPLHVIMSMLDLLFESPAYVGLPAPDHQSFKTIRSSAMVMSTLFNDVLDMSKIEAGKMTVEPRSFEIRKLIESLVLENRPANSNPQLLSNIDPSVPVWIVSDPLRVRQIVLNLIQNAIKFTANGFVRVNVTTVAPEESKLPNEIPRSGDMKLLRLAVEDTGIGLTEAAMKKLFDPFEQCKASVAREYGGTGLGLSIVRALTEVLGGTVRVRSRVGHGTTFTIEMMAEIGKPMVSPPSLRPLPPVEPSVDTPSTAAAVAAAAAGKSVTWSLNQPNAVIAPSTSSAAGAVAAAVASISASPTITPSDPVVSIGGESAMLASAAARAAGMASPPFVPSPVIMPTTISGLKLVRLLIVDDSEINLRIMSTIVKRPGYDVVVARNGYEAIEAVVSSAARIMHSEIGGSSAVVIGGVDTGTPTNGGAESGGGSGGSADSGSGATAAAAGVPPDLRKDPKLLPYVNRAFDFIFMDIAMPLMDGMEATRQLRSIWNCQTPIVAVTANALASDREKCLSAGVSDFLPKPFRREQIYAVLHKFSIGSH